MNEQKSEKAQNHTKSYLMVFGALAILTALTVVISYVHLNRGSAIGIALTIVAVKASLIVAFFMHLRYENRLIYAIFFIALFLALALLMAVLPDLVR